MKLRNAFWVPAFSVNWIETITHVISKLYLTIWLNSSLIHQLFVNSLLLLLLQQESCSIHDHVSMYISCKRISKAVLGILQSMLLSSWHLRGLSSLESFSKILGKNCQPNTIWLLHILMWHRVSQLFSSESEEPEIFWESDCRQN